MTQTALILGANGRIGGALKTAFDQAGWETRRYTRGSDMTAAAQGCDVIVNGLNPPDYHNWAEILPATTRQVIDAARASGATVLFPGNVYVFGDQPAPWDENTPHKAPTRKGQIRIATESAYARAATDHGIQTIILRAGDFLSPTPQGSALDALYFRSLKRGKITAMGDPDVRRAHAWLPDLARAGVGLAQKRAQLPLFCDVPFAGHCFSARELRDATQTLLGRPLTLSPFPWPLLMLAAPFWELARELREMRYLFNHPHQLRNDRLLSLLPNWQDTPMPVWLAHALRASGHDAAPEMRYAGAPV